MVRAVCCRHPAQGSCSRGVTFWTKPERVLQGGSQGCLTTFSPDAGFLPHAAATNFYHRAVIGIFPASHHRRANEGARHRRRLPLRSRGIIAGGRRPQSTDFSDAAHLVRRLWVRLSRIIITAGRHITLDCRAPFHSSFHAFLHQLRRIWGISARFTMISYQSLRCHYLLNKNKIVVAI